VSRASSPPSSLSSLLTRADVPGVGESALSALQILRVPPKIRKCTDFQHIAVCRRVCVPVGVCDFLIGHLGLSTNGPTNEYILYS